MIQDLKNGNNNPNEGMMVFYSSEYSRQGEEKKISAHRAIVITTHFLCEEGYMIAINNLDSLILQLSPKHMKITMNLKDCVVLEGCKSDSKSEDSSNYSLHILFDSNDEIQEIKLILRDLNTTITYYK